MRWLIEAMTLGRCRRTSDTKIFNTRFVILSYHDSIQKLLVGMTKLANGSPKQSWSGSQNEDAAIEISPEADAAMAELMKIFSDPNLPSKVRFRCGVEGPDEFDVMFESIMEEQFGDSEYKQWVKRLYDLGLIARLPDEWK